MDIVCILQKCFIDISNKIRFTNAFDLSSKIDIKNSSGDLVKKLDFVSNNTVSYTHLTLPTTPYV